MSIFQLFEVENFTDFFHPSSLLCCSSASRSHPCQEIHVTMATAELTIPASLSHQQFLLRHCDEHNLISPRCSEGFLGLFTNMTEFVWLNCSTDAVKSPINIFSVLVKIKEENFLLSKNSKLMPFKIFRVAISSSISLGLQQGHLK